MIDLYRPYDPIWDMYYDEFEDMEENQMSKENPSADTTAYAIKGKKCGRGKDGVFRCVCGKCEPGMEKNQVQYIRLDCIGNKMYFCVGDESIEIDDYNIITNPGGKVKIEVQLTLQNVCLTRLEFLAEKAQPSK